MSVGEKQLLLFWYHIPNYFISNLLLNYMQFQMKMIFMKNHFYLRGEECYDPLIFTFGNLIL